MSWIPVSELKKRLEKKYENKQDELLDKYVESLVKASLNESWMFGRNKIIREHQSDFEDDHRINMVVAENILFDLKEIFDSRNIPFWLCSGTLLGIYRDGKLFDTDSDMDIAVRLEDMQRINECIDLFKMKGFDYAPIPDAVLYRYGEHLDLCTYVLEGDKRACSDGIMPAPEKTHRVDSIDFDTPNFVNWKGKRWRIFNNVEKHLESEFGDWKAHKEIQKDIFIRKKRPHTAADEADRALGEFKDLADSLDITSFLYHGTALAFYLNGEWPFTDPDIDVGILCSESKRNTLFEELHKKGFILNRTDDVINNVPFVRDGIILDVYFAGFEEQDKMKYLKDFEKLEYKGRVYNIPSPMEDFIIDRYGEDWKMEKFPGFTLNGVGNQNVYELKEGYILTEKGVFSIPKLCMLIIHREKLVRMERLSTMKIEKYLKNQGRKVEEYKLG